MVRFNLYCRLSFLLSSLLLFGLPLSGQGSQFSFLSGVNELVNTQAKLDLIRDWTIESAIDHKGSDYLQLLIMEKAPRSNSSTMTHHRKESFFIPGTHHNVIYAPGEQQTSASTGVNQQNTASPTSGVRYTSSNTGAEPIISGLSSNGGGDDDRNDDQDKRNRQVLKSKIPADVVIQIEDESEEDEEDIGGEVRSKTPVQYHQPDEPDALSSSENEESISTTNNAYFLAQFIHIIYYHYPFLQDVIIDSLADYLNRLRISNNHALIQQINRELAATLYSIQLFTFSTHLTERDELRMVLRNLISPDKALTEPDALTAVTNALTRIFVHLDAHGVSVNNSMRAILTVLFREFGRLFQIAQKLNPEVAQNNYLGPVATHLSTFYNHYIDISEMIFHITGKPTQGTQPDAGSQPLSHRLYDGLTAIVTSSENHLELETHPAPESPPPSGTHSEPETHATPQSHPLLINHPDLFESLLNNLLITHSADIFAISEEFLKILDDIFIDDKDESEEEE